jgi:ankyrin repeat protein
MIGETPLSYAVVNGVVNTVRYLLDHGANPDEPIGDLRCTALHMAVTQGQSSILFFCKQLFIIICLFIFDESK